MPSDYMSAENAVTEMVEAMLPRMSYHRLGLMICLDIEAEDFGSEENDYEDGKRAWYELKFIFVRPSNYTQVYVSSRCDRKAEDKWELHSDHDSCWRSDGTRRIFRCLREVCSHVAPDKPFTAANPRIRFSSFKSPSYVLLKPRMGFGLLDGKRELSYYYDRDNRDVVDFEVEKKLNIKEAIPYLEMKSNIAW